MVALESQGCDQISLWGALSRTLSWLFNVSTTCLQPFPYVVVIHSVNDISVKAIQQKKTAVYSSDTPHAVVYVPSYPFRSTDCRAGRKHYKS